MKRKQRNLGCVIIALALIGQAPVASGFPWNKDFVDQVSLKAQEALSPRGSNALPVTGGEILPPMPDSITEAEMDALKDEAASIPNPVAATAESIARGAELYELTCQVCHGASGDGEGPVGVKFTTKAPVDLSDEYTQDQADGSIFFTLTRGRALMPFYRDVLSVEERWHVVNYIKSEFGT